MAFTVYHTAWNICLLISGSKIIFSTPIFFIISAHSCNWFCKQLHGHVFKTLDIYGPHTVNVTINDFVNHFWSAAKYNKHL